MALFDDDDDDDDEGVLLLELKERRWCVVVFGRYVLNKNVVISFDSSKSQEERSVTFLWNEHVVVLLVVPCCRIGTCRRCFTANVASQSSFLSSLSLWLLGAMVRNLHVQWLKC